MRIDANLEFLSIVKGIIISSIFVYLSLDSKGATEEISASFAIVEDILSCYSYFL